MAWLSGWQYRRKITVDGNKIDANLTNFPVAVILNSSRFSFSKARSDGYDVRFADESGNLLKYERERHDATNQVAEYHVKIPSLTAGQNYEFYCYSPDTDILTEIGWVNIKELVESRLQIKIATLNPEIDRVEYHYPRMFFKIFFEGKLLWQRGKLVDFLVTPNHRVWAKPAWLKSGSGKKNTKGFSLIRADKLPKIVAYRRDFPYEGERKEKFILPAYYKEYEVKKGKRISKRKEKIFPMDDWLRFFGIWLAEGSLRKKGEIVISQKILSKRKIIKRWIEKLGYKVTETLDGLIFCDVQLNTYLRQFGHASEKYIPPEFKNLSKEQLKILLDALVLGDGSIRPGKDGYYATISKRLADDVQEIALKVSYVSTTATREDACYIVSLSQKKKITIPYNNKKKDNNCNREWVDYQGYVYCVEVPNHIVYVRRNGKPHWNGNCYYGNPNADDGADPTNVWDSNFKGVWHLKDYTTSSVKDSTSNANDGTKKASNEPIEVDAKIGKGQSFDGSDDYIGVNNSSSLNITTLTLELFLNIDSSKTDFMMPITKYSNSYWVLQINSGTGTTRVLRWIANGLNHFDYTISTDIWKHIVITHSGTNALLYVDGVNVSSSNQTSIPNNPVDLFIGKRNDGYYFKGVIDEVRISNVARSAAWIKASYHSCNDTLLSFGPEEEFVPLSSRRLLLAN